jgi:hypothetical protein
MVGAIIKKEWLKFRYFFIILMLFLVGLGAYFSYRLDFLYHSIEPHTMMWHKFNHFGEKPYAPLYWVFVFLGAFVATVQFVFERIKNRVKIMTHLPLFAGHVIGLHLIVGVLYLLLFISVIWIFVTTSIASHYPPQILTVALKDMLFYTLASIGVYLMLSAAILEKNATVFALKLLGSVAMTLVFYQNGYSASDLALILLVLSALALVVDSFYTVKSHRIHPLLLFASVAVVVSITTLHAYQSYKTQFAKEFNRYYVFYSSVLEDFIYQKNYPGHRFEYFDASGKEYDKTKYENLLPFVYWRNLKMQNALPLHIQNRRFDETKIKQSALALSYHPRDLKENEIRMYPFFNPQSKKGMIAFASQMLVFTNDTLQVYEENATLGKTNEKLREMLKKEGFSHPVKKVWGNATNMKSYDLGYMLLDNSGRLFNLFQADSNVHLQEFAYPKGATLAYLKLSENDTDEIVGYAIDTDSNVYLLGKGDFTFKKLALKGFDYRWMQLQIIANPLFYTIRFDDGKRYGAVAFDKALNKLDEFYVH